jgi:predicted ATP-dependent protease
MEGKKLTDDGGNKISFIEIVLGDEDTVPESFTFEEFSELEEYIEPKTTREIELEEKVKELEHKLETYKILDSENEKRRRKPPNRLSDEKQEEIVEFYVANKPITIVEVSEKYNISPNYCAFILDKYGVRIIKPNKNRVKQDV